MTLSNSIAPDDSGGSTDTTSELAGEATLDSPPAERDSKAGENGLETGADDGISLPGPTFKIDEPETDADEA